MLIASTRWLPAFRPIACSARSGTLGLGQIRQASSKSPNGTPADRRKAYSHTLLLPKTDFPLKHKDIVAAEKRYRTKTSDELYIAQSKRHDNPLFVLHDGPPYANGNLHMGHALNKVLKDIINRYNVVRGKRVHYRPGWDCHGLPIEHKALKAIGKSHTSLKPAQVRAEAKKVALDAIDVQKTEMRALGVMADWDGHKGTYRTLDHDFEIRQLRLFKTMVERGYVTHRRRPTYYSPSNRTALAEAELSYTDGHKSRSVYVGFPVAPEDMSQHLERVYDSSCKGQTLELAIWTTTPWSLPGNMGVSVSSDMAYVIVKTGAGRHVLIAEERLQPMEEILGAMEVCGRLSGNDLVGTRYTHMFYPPSSSVAKPTVFISKHVTASAGTGLVHSAPAHGHEDYESFATAGILPDEPRCPIDDDGRFTTDLTHWTEDGDYQTLVGKEVLGDGTDEMVRLLAKSGHLLAEQVIEHRYPYDWKSKKPIIVRATPQWFADIEGVKQTATDALNHVAFHPPQSRKRLEAFVTSRSEWCISRQRSWGVPIPALFGSNGPVMDGSTLDHIIRVLDDKGIDHWWDGSVEDFIPDHLRGQQLTRGYDTLDVWFDSGSSWTMLDADRAGKPPADVYLEGSDQHRGWFQSSLLTKVISTPDGQAPYSTVITHGFVMDEQGEKMSKSAGNGLSPDLPAYGADVLRLWTASVDYTNDASIGPSSINQAAETLRKLRNTTRFMLANTVHEPAIPLSEVTLNDIDRYILHELAQLEQTVEEAYGSYAFNRVVHNTATFASTTLSAFYFDVIKDALYCNAASDHSRQAIIAVLRHTLSRITRILAPITPHLAEELHEHFGPGNQDSVFLEAWTPDSSSLDHGLKTEMTVLLAVRGLVQKLIEDARAAKHIKTPSQTQVHLAVDGPAMSWYNAPYLAAALGVSSVKSGQSLGSPAGWHESSRLDTDTGTVVVTLSSSARQQCARCWQYTADQKLGLCLRCGEVVNRHPVSTS